MRAEMRAAETSGPPAANEARNSLVIYCNRSVTLRRQRNDLQISGRLGRSDKGLSRALGIRLGRGARIWKAQEQARSAEPSVFGPLGSENASPGAMLWCRRCRPPHSLTRKADTPYSEGGYPLALSKIGPSQEQLPRRVTEEIIFSKIAARFAAAAPSINAAQHWGTYRGAQSPLGLVAIERRAVPPLAACK